MTVRVRLQLVLLVTLLAALAVLGSLWTRVPLERAGPERSPPDVASDPSTSWHSSETIVPSQPPESAAPRPLDQPILSGSIRGTVRYEDGAPGVGLRLTAAGVAHTDHSGSFCFYDAEAGPCWLALEAVLLEKFLLLPAKEHRLDVVIPRGGVLRGTVVTADDGSPARGCPVLVSSAHWTVLSTAVTEADGTFVIGWLPGGSYDVVVYPGYRRSHGSAAVSVLVDAAGCDLSVHLPAVPQLPMRFENLPVEWRERVPLAVWFFDDAGHLLTLPPSNKIGWPGGERWIEVDANGTPIGGIPAPGLGHYRLALLDPHYRETPWLQISIDVRRAMDGIVVNVPAGARVNVVARAARLGQLAIGPAVAGKSVDGVFRFPRVPSGRHEIWRLDRWSRVRVGEIDVAVGDPVLHELYVPRDGRIRAQLQRPARVELRRLSDGGRVAELRGDKHLGIDFWPVDGGAYELLVGGHAIPLVLTAGQDLDLGLVDVR